MLKTDKNIKTIKIIGDLNILSYSRTQSLLSTEAMDDFNAILLDLSEVKHVDSSGMGALISLHEKLARQGKEMVLISLSKSCAKVLYLLGLQKILRIYEGREEALEVMAPS